MHTSQQYNGEIPRTANDTDFQLYNFQLVTPLTMKTYVVAFLLAIFCLQNCFGQNPNAHPTELNYLKYWKYRDRYLRHFVTPGLESFGGSSVNGQLCYEPNPATNVYGSGLSIPSGGVVGGWRGQIDYDSVLVDPNNPNSGYRYYGGFGVGDGVINLGYYMAFLATEYAMLDNAGKNTQMIKS